MGQLLVVQKITYLRPIASLFENKINNLEEGMESWMEIGE